MGAKKRIGKEMSKKHSMIDIQNEVKLQEMRVITNTINFYHKSKAEDEVGGGRAKNVRSQGKLFGAEHYNSK